MNWNWDNLKYFLALADRQTLKAAAAELDVSHTTVLRRVKAFEAQLGTQLFTHSQQGYRLTENGQALRIQADTLKRSVESIARTVIGADKQIGGKVTVTTPDTIGYQLMPSILARLRTAYPDVQVELQVQNSFSDITRLEAEIAIRAGNNPPPELIGKKLGSLPFCVCASDSYLRRQPARDFPGETPGHSFILLSSRFESSVFYQWLTQRIGDGETVAIADGLMSAYQLCNAGLGITLLPRYLLALDNSLIELNVNEPVPVNELWILNHKDLRNSATIKAVKAFLYDEIQTLLSENTDNQPRPANGASID